MNQSRTRNKKYHKNEVWIMAENRKAWNKWLDEKTKKKEKEM